MLGEGERVSLENTHMTDIIQTEKDVFRSICVHAKAHTYITTLNKKKEAMNLKRARRGKWELVINCDSHMECLLPHSSAPARPYLGAHPHPLLGLKSCKSLEL